MSWFRRRAKRGALERLRGPWRCAGCGELHEGLIDIAAFAPDPWPNAEIYEPNDSLRLEGDFLSEDFCVMGGRYFFARCVLEIPVHGFADKFGFGCWSTLSRTNFDKFLGGFNDSVYADWGPWPGWLGNRLADYIGTEPEAVHVFPQPNRQRPTLRVQDGNHPLAIAQSEGITPERMLEILRACGHILS
jgi:hypothetical protein